MEALRRIEDPQDSRVYYVVHVNDDGSTLWWRIHTEVEGTHVVNETTYLPPVSDD